MLTQAREMAQQLEQGTALPQDLGLVPSTLVKWLTACNSSSFLDSSGTAVLCIYHTRVCISKCGHVHTHTQLIIKIFIPLGDSCCIQLWIMAILGFSSASGRCQVETHLNPHPHPLPLQNVFWEEWEIRSIGSFFTFFRKKTCLMRKNLLPIDASPTIFRTGERSCPLG